MGAPGIRKASVVREVVEPVLRWEAEVVNKTFTGSRDGAVVADDGLTIKVRGADLRGDRVRTKAPWSEVATRFGLPAGDAAPFSEVTLEIIELVPGAAIEVIGEVTDYALADDGGPRDAPTSRPRTVAASIVGIGKRASELVDSELAKREREARPRRGLARKGLGRRVVSAIASMSAAQIADVVVLAIAAALLVIAARVAFRASNLHAVVGFVCGVVAITAALRPRHVLVPFRAREKVHGRVWHLDVVWRCAAFVFAMFPLVMGLGISTGSVPVGPGDHVRVGAEMIAAFGLGLIAIFVAGEVIGQRTVANLSRLASAEAIEGVIRTSKPQRFGDRSGVLGLTENWDSAWTTDAKGNSRTTNRMKSASFAAAPSFTVEEVEVASSDVAWASTLRFRHDPKTGGWNMHEIIPANARVVVVGAREGDRLRANGLSPVLLFGGPAEPKQWARRAVRARYITRAILAASAVGLVWSIV
jgi:hypothetical protein